MRLKAALLHFQRPFRMDNIDKRTRKERCTARNFAESCTRGSLKRVPDSQGKTGERVKTAKAAQ